MRDVSTDGLAAALIRDAAVWNALELREEGLHTVDAFFDIGVGDGVGEPQVLPGAEGFAGNGDDVRLVEQA